MKKSEKGNIDLILSLAIFAASFVACYIGYNSLVKQLSERFIDLSFSNSIQNFTFIEDNRPIGTANIIIKNNTKLSGHGVVAFTDEKISYNFDVQTNLLGQVKEAKLTALSDHDSKLEILIKGVYPIKITLNSLSKKNQISTHNIYNEAIEITLAKKNSEDIEKNKITISNSKFIQKINESLNIQLVDDAKNAKNSKLTYDNFIKKMDKILRNKR